MSARKWNFYYDDKQSRFSVAHIVDAASLWIAIGLLWLSFVRIIKEVFPAFLHAEVIRYEFSVMGIGDKSNSITEYIDIDWWVILMFLICLWLPVSGFLPKDKRIWRVIPWLVSFGIPVWYALSRSTRIANGFLSIAHEYIEKYNSYRHMYIVYPEGAAEDAPVAFTLIMMLLWLFVWIEYALLKKKIVLVIFPVIPLIAEFMVGLSSTKGLSYAFVAAFLLLIPKGVHVIRHVLVVCIVMMGLFISNMAFSEKANELATEEKAEDVKNWYKNIDWSKFDLSGLLSLDFSLNRETLDNKEPEFTGKVVLEIEAAQTPAGNLYLKGFCGDTYKNGTWTWNYNAFSEACKEAGYDEETVAKTLSQMPYNVMEQTTFAISSPITNQYTISYKGVMGDTAYTPYLFSHKTLDEEYDFVGDFLIRKGGFDNTVSVEGFRFGDEVAYSFIELYERDRSDLSVMQWYNEVAQNYAVSSTDMECIQKAAKRIKDRVYYPTSAELENYTYYMMLGNKVYQENAQENLYRIRLIEEVKQYLADNMSYSLKLDDLPFGTDPVEYALTEGHEGYCMHYATAGALILKELGVPVRYASGYVVHWKDFERDFDKEVSYTEVTDYNAHAWVEVYMEDMGWFPIEMTEGYSSDESLPTTLDQEELENKSESEREEFESETQEPPTETTSESESQEEPSETEGTENSETESSESEEDSSTEGDSEMESDTTDIPGGDEGGDSGTPSGYRAILKTLMDLLLLLLKIAAVIAGLWIIRWLYRYCKKRYEAVLQKEIDDGRTRKAVTRMNRRIYRKLRIQMLYVTDWNDTAYEKLLTERYPKMNAEDWKHYMEIVKKAHYSRETISKEEMMHCYKCYMSR